MTGNFHSWFLCLVALVGAIDPSDIMDAFLKGPEYTVLDSETSGWHTYMLRMVQDFNNETYLEDVDVVSMSENPPPDASFHNATALERLKRSCGKTDSSSCAFVNGAARVFFTMGLKYFQCQNSGPNKYRFRFSARYPGTYVIRLQSSRGSYILVVRTYKGNQVVNFVWPWRRVHVGSDMKAFLMIKPDSASNVFSPQFHWTVLDLEHVLGGTVSTGNADFNLIFKSRNVAMVEQMRPFDNDPYIKVGSCRFTDL